MIDYGTGIGRLAKELIARFGCRVLGVDISQEMRGLGPAYVASDRFACVSPELFGAMIRSGLRADAAISVWVLQHCAQPTQDIDLLQSALRPGGDLFVVNNLHRAVPVRPEPGDRSVWASDGLDIGDLLRARFELRAEGRLDPAVVGADVSQLTFWAAYRQR